MMNKRILAFFLVFTLLIGIAPVKSAKAASMSVSVATDQSTYTCAMGQKFKVEVTVTTQETYEEGSHLYIGYLAVLRDGAWDQIKSWYIDGGVVQYTFTLNSSDFEEGNFKFTASVFPADNFTVGASLYDKFFYVNFVESSYTVKFDPNGGECDSTYGSVIYGCTYGELPVPVRTGYEFAGWYTDPREGQGSEVTGETIVDATADHTIYAHWTEVEPDIIDFEELAYCFSNTSESFGYSDSYKFPYTTFKRLWGSSTLAKYYYTYYNGPWTGSCYGMSSSSVMFNMDKDDVEIPDFNSSAKLVGDLKVGDTSENLDITLTQLIETMQVSQFDSSIIQAIQNSYGNLDGLSEEVSQEETEKTPVLICIYGPEGGHAIVGYELKEVNETTSYLYVYDCNYPEDIRYITLTKNASGNYTGWYYHLNNVYDWGSAYEGCRIGYVTYDTFTKLWNNRGGTKSGFVNVMTLNTENASIYDYEGNKVAALKDGILNSSKEDIYQYVPLTVEKDNTFSDMPSMICMPTNLYTIKNTDSEIKELQVSMVNVEQSAAVTTTANKVTFAVNDSEKLNTVSVSTEEGDTYNIVLDSTLSCNEDKEEIEYYGVGTGTTVTLGTAAGNMIISNCSGLNMWVNGKETEVEEKEEVKEVETQKDISEFSVKLSQTQYKYNGYNHEPSVVVKGNGTTLKKGINYIVVYENNVNAGTATAKVYGIGGYKGVKSLNYTISKAENNITASNITKTTSTSVQKVLLKATAKGGAKLTYASDTAKVKVNSSGKITIAKDFVGTAVITIKDAETTNYKAAKKAITVKVNPKGTTITKVKNTGKKKITVQWKKNKNVTGYRIQYSTSSNFGSKVKTVTIKKNKTTKTTIKKLSKKKTYYFRIQTYKKVGKKIYYSKWSSVKKKLVKK